MRIHRWIWFLVFLLLFSILLLSRSSISNWLIIFVTIIYNITEWRIMTLITYLCRYLMRCLILSTWTLHFVTSVINISCRSHNISCPTTKLSLIRIRWSHSIIPLTTTSIYSLICYITFMATLRLRRMRRL